MIRHNSQRGWFAYELLEHAKKDENIIVVTADLGYGMWDQFRDQLPNQFYNVGAAEQAGMGIAVGLALEGKKPFIYSITSFLLYRPFETIRNYIHYEAIPVRLVGSGRDDDYKHDGYSHHSFEANVIMRVLYNINTLWPQEKEEIPKMVEQMVKEDKSWFISLKR